MEILLIFAKRVCTKSDVRVDVYGPNGRSYRKWCTNARKSTKMADMAGSQRQTALKKNCKVRSVILFENISFVAYKWWFFFQETLAVFISQGEPKRSFGEPLFFWVLKRTVMEIRRTSIVDYSSQQLLIDHAIDVGFRNRTSANL